MWFRWNGAFEVVIAKGDVKLRHLAANPECILVVFESVPPFRGVLRHAGWRVKRATVPAPHARDPKVLAPAEGEIP